MAEQPQTMTDPAREMAELLSELVTGDTNLTGDRYLAEKFGVAPWSQDFYRILATIMDRLQTLREIVKDFPLDDDYRGEMVGHIDDIALAFTPNAFQKPLARGWGRQAERAQLAALERPVRPCEAKGLVPEAV